MSEFKEEYEEPTKKKLQLSDLGKKILTYSIIVIVSIGVGAAVTGIPMAVRESAPRKDLEQTDYYLRSIIDSFEVNVFNLTSEGFNMYNYTYNDTSTFEDIGGSVIYNDEQKDLEYIKIFFPSTTDLSIESVTFNVKQKSQLNVIIFADNREVYNARKIKSDINLEFPVLASEIYLYVF
ncbi:MAG: hypothetical protein U9O98_08015 [Asgard group archaeon]|nr:hypothetical protein [Asgard group archaeon]